MSTETSNVAALVDRAIQAATPPGQHVERKLRPESEYGWMEPTPLAGLRAALAVVEAAQQQAYKFARGLRGEGTPWREIADLLQVPWSDEYARPERAYELVLGPDPDGGSRFHARSVYWRCGGPLGCGQYITDRGPYDGYPGNNESGHADGCRRLAAEVEAHEREAERQEERDRVADEAMKQLEGDSFGKETVRRARWVLAHGGQYQGWSTSEALAVALVLHHDDRLDGYSSRRAAAERVGRSPDWLATVRAAATGQT